MAFSQPDLISRLRLALSENVGPVTYKILLSYFESAEEALCHLSDFAKRGGRVKKLVPASISSAEKQLDYAYRFQTQLLFSDCPDYPELLRQIDACPPVLFVRGNSALLSQKSVAVVGTRNASLNGKNFARKMARELAEKNICVVSGLARGIDAAAHEGALFAGQGGTVGVLGTAVDQIYPPENKDLFDAVVRQGCVVSEFPFETKMAAGNFPRRNRIVSGLSLGTVVIEAQMRSGSLITAKDALSQGRAVFAVPGSPMDPRSAGPNHLIQQGAVLVQQTQDILDELNQPLTLFEHQFKNEVGLVYKPSVGELDEARQIVLENLSLDSVFIDALIRETGLSAAVVNIILVELELAGRLVRQSGQRVALIQE